MRGMEKELRKISTTLTQIGNFIGSKKVVFYYRHTLFVLGWVACLYQLYQLDPDINNTPLKILSFLVVWVLTTRLLLRAFEQFIDPFLDRTVNHWLTQVVSLVVVISICPIIIIPLLTVQPFVLFDYSNDNAVDNLSNLANPSDRLLEVPFFVLFLWASQRLTQYFVNPSSIIPFVNPKHGAYGLHPLTQSLLLF